MKEVKEQLTFTAIMESNVEEEDRICNPVLDEDEFVLITKSDLSEEICKDKVHRDENDLLNNIESSDQLNPYNKENHILLEDDTIENQIIQIEKEFKHWTNLRRDTILKLREIAEYIGK